MIHFKFKKEMIHFLFLNPFFLIAEILKNFFFFAPKPI